MTARNDVKMIERKSRPLLGVRAGGTIRLVVNGKRYNLRFGDDVEPWETPAYMETS